jgi:hypothetical protein
MVKNTTWPGIFFVKVGGYISDASKLAEACRAGPNIDDFADKYHLLPTIMKSSEYPLAGMRIAPLRA